MVSLFYLLTYCNLLFSSPFECLPLVDMALWPFIDFVFDIYDHINPSDIEPGSCKGDLQRV